VYGETVIKEQVMVYPSMNVSLVPANLRATASLVAAGCLILAAT